MQVERHRLAGVRWPSLAPLRWVALWTAAVMLPVAMPAAAAPAKDQPAESEKEKKIPEPKEVELQTEDGLKLMATYYPGIRGKETIPVVLLHMWKQSRNDYKDLAPVLQAIGCAVVVPDLRGHGDSTHLK